MTISLNWLRQYITTGDLNPEQIGEILTGTGLEVEGIEAVDSIPGGLRGLVVGQVVECERHPNADKLSLTKVNVGTGELLSIVCGAPNVAAGQKVVVALEGTKLYPVEGEPFTIKKGKIRGEASEGMLCAEDEIGLGHSHAGIIVLPDETPIGLEVANYYGLSTDYVYEIGLTPNRSDATCHLGVAYDLAAALRVNHGFSGEVCRPEVAAFKIDDASLPIHVEVRNTEACPRYTGVVLKGITVKESPEWLKTRLRAVGVRPINNIVDVTNFILHELGQPLHAFDYDAIAGQRVIVQTLPKETTFLSLDEQERKLHEEDLMICDGQSNGMCIGGVFGGLNSGVKDSTRNIFLESAHFNAEWIRRSSMRHNLRTDAAKVFEKGSDPNITLYALKRAILLMQELAGGEVASELIDIYPQPITPKAVDVRYSRVNMLIGHPLSPEKVHEILRAMGMDILQHDEKAFTVAVPTNKVDVTREVDVIEEILRIYGLNNVPEPGKISTSPALAAEPNPTRVRNVAADLLAANGFNEMMALSLSESKYYAAASDLVPADALVYINNTSNVHLDIMRPTMLYSGLEAVLRNQNRQEADLRLFEFGRTYKQTSEGAYDESNRLTLFLSGKRQPESWHNTGKESVDFYTLKAYVDMVLQRLGVSGFQSTEAPQDAMLGYGLQYARGHIELVRFGQVTGKTAKDMGIKDKVFYADFNWDNVLKAIPRKRTAFVELNKFPTTRRDLALVVETSVHFNEIAAIAQKAAKNILRSVNLFDVYVNEEQLGADKKSYAVSFTFAHPERTLQDKEVDAVMAQIIERCESQLKALIRK